MLKLDTNLTDPNCRLNKSRALKYRVSNYQLESRNIPQNFQDVFRICEHLCVSVDDCRLLYTRRVSGSSCLHFPLYSGVLDWKCRPEIGFFREVLLDFSCYCKLAKFGYCRFVILRFWVTVGRATCEVLTAVCLRCPLFCDMTLCHWVIGSARFESATFPRNVGNRLPSAAASYPRRTESRIVRQYRDAV